MLKDLAVSKFLLAITTVLWTLFANPGAKHGPPTADILIFINLVFFMGTVKWGILGAAKIAKEQVIPAMKKSKNTELYAIAARDISKAEDFCHKFAITKAYDDYNKLISDPNIDAVYIPLPNHIDLYKY